MRTRALNINLDEDAKKRKKWRPFEGWPRPASKRSLLERALRKVWLFRWDAHSKSFVMSGVEYCQTIGYRDQKIARYFPKRNWLKEEFPYIFTNMKRRWDNAYWWIRHRIPGRYWHHTLKLGIEPGYHDADTKMLHAVFETICWYVEVQLASHQDSDRKEFKWYGDRSPQAGIAHLDWEIADCSGAPAGQIGQGEAAQIKKDVYLWWTVERPNRIDSHDVYDIVDPDHRKRFKGTGLWGMLSDKSETHSRAMWGSMALDEFYKQEDQEMLTKAVSILHHWWD